MIANLKKGELPSENVKINICGSKSESNRLLILQAEFPNISIENLSDSDDTAVLQKGLRVLKGTVDVHHAGTAMRFLTAYFAAKEGADVLLTGSQRMRERPIEILVNALRNLGADIEYAQNEGFPPLKIKGKNLQKNEVTIKADLSSQYISALMLIAPMLPTGLIISLEGKITSIPYIEMTLQLLKNIGVTGNFDGNSIVISPIKSIEDVRIVVESDWSSASYFYSLVALSENLQITLGNFSKESLQGDAALVQLYNSLGVETVFNTSDDTISLSKKSIELPDSLLLNLANTPDLAQTIAVSCFGLGVSCRLTGLHTLKIKETDRLLALKTELEKLGASVQIDSNSLNLEKSLKISKGIAVETYQDHRMAMAFAPLALKTEITINSAGVVSKSYPKFWEDIEKTGVNCVFKQFKN
jgi:3-phosphoshikimate 1-carboxyvinyltransferase